ncbi:DUF5776 domain-containing protein [Levilactobacillus zymae]|uniref:DUF5776 domain-containing protein n=1 Tax=Levilactobacillus zymae TaxID=267363 RepID=UPI0028BAA5AD|nr:DUF5776 domain-containing protein [Levilactobacillus zymae]MDT6979825.1 DUF5776 domain-containing protein [Levilactobacillus zymae]
MQSESIAQSKASAASLSASISSSQVVSTSQSLSASAAVVASQSLSRQQSQSQSRSRSVAISLELSQSIAQSEAQFSTATSQSQNQVTRPIGAPTASLKEGSALARPTRFKRFSVNSDKKIGLYRKPTFTKGNRIRWYAKQPRSRQPQFVVIGVTTSKHGVLRYRVKDVNHHSKTYGTTGYVTARRAFVKRTYHVQRPQLITVLNPQGIDSYRTAKLKGKVTHYRQGQQLKVQRVVKHHLTTRYQLTNGRYVTANKQLVYAGRLKYPRRITVRYGANLYRDVNFHARAGQHYVGHQTVRVLGWNYSDHGTLRYRISGGYVTANQRYVSATTQHLLAGERLL